MKRKSLLGALAVLAILVAWLTGAFETELSDEDQVRQLIEDIADGAEAADIEAVMGPFSKRYSDPEGLDRRGIYGIFWSQFKKRGPITVVLSGIDVQITQDSATAAFDAGLAEGQEGGMLSLPVNLDALTFEVELSRESDGWRIVSHSRWSALDIERNHGP